MRKKIEVKIIKPTYYLEVILLYTYFRTKCMKLHRENRRKFYFYVKKFLVVELFKNILED